MSDSVALSRMQACRGGKFDYGVEMDSTDSADPVSDTLVKEVMEQQVCVLTTTCKSPLVSVPHVCLSHA